MTQIQYLDYLLTDHWKNFSEEYKRNHPNCEISSCGMSRYDSRFFYGQDLNVHHLQHGYKNLWHESWTDVKCLCIRCHEIEHFGASGKIDWAAVLNEQEAVA
jgi:hypothetical protein